MASVLSALSGVFCLIVILIAVVEEVLNACARLQNHRISKVARRLFFSFTAAVFMDGLFLMLSFAALEYIGKRDLTIICGLCHRSVNSNVPCRSELHFEERYTTCSPVGDINAVYEELPGSPRLDLVCLRTAVDLVELLYLPTVSLILR